MAEGVNAHTTLTEVNQGNIHPFLHRHQTSRLPLGETDLAALNTVSIELISPPTRSCSLFACRLILGNQLDALRVQQPVSC